MLLELRTGLSVFGTLSKAAQAQIREMVRDELRSELQRILNPTFIQLVTDGAREMETVLDAVLDFENSQADLAASVKLLERRIEKLERERGERP